MTQNVTPIGNEDGVAALSVTNVNPPDWETFKEELLCPLCEYNLRGISEPRCPECGYRFTWYELVDALHNQHPYVFEQQDRGRFGAFWKTAAGGLRPGRFWRKLKPSQRSHPGRIWFYFAVVMAVGLTDEFWTMFATDSWNIDVPVLGRALTIPAGPLVLFLTIYWPIATLLTLMIFRISMRRVHLRPVHALRCVLYNFDGIIWFGFLLIGGGCFYLLVDSAPFVIYRPDQMPYILSGLSAGCLAFFIYRLCRAYELYMRFDRPIATVLASQVIVLLFFLTAFAVSPGVAELASVLKQAL